MPRTDAGSLHQNRVILGRFEVHGTVYALDVAQVREVVRWQPATALPKAPTLIEGIVELRGAVIPVIDLGCALEGKPVVPGNRTRIVVAEADGLTVGLVVDAANDVMAVALNALDDPPALATQAGYETIRAVVRRGDEAPVLVLSLEHLLESVYRSALNEEGVA